MKNNVKIMLSIFFSVFVVFFSADMLAQSERKLPSTKDARKFIKMFESEYKIKKADVKTPAIKEPCVQW